MRFYYIRRARTQKSKAYNTKKKLSHVRPVWYMELELILVSELELDPPVPIRAFGWLFGTRIRFQTQFHVIQMQNCVCQFFGRWSRIDILNM